MLRVLVVEDSPAMRTFVRAVLEDGPEEVEVHEAASGFDALRLLPRASYGLVITDINMPDINGLELLRFVRQGPQHRDTAVLVISTMSSEIATGRWRWARTCSWPSHSPRKRSATRSRNASSFAAGARPVPRSPDACGQRPAIGAAPRVEVDGRGR